MICIAYLLKKADVTLHKPVPVGFTAPAVIRTAAAVTYLVDKAVAELARADKPKKTYR